MEALLAAERQRRVRGVLRRAGNLEPERAPRADVRLDGGARACFRGGRKGGQEGQALGRSRGGFSTKIHLKSDLDGYPLGFHLTGGEANDSPQFGLLLDIGPDITPRAVMTDKGYDSKANRQAARDRGICPVIPYRSTTLAKPKFFPKTLYKARARIEQTMGKLKRFKRIALRCEKTEKHYRSLISFAAGLVLIKSVHRT